MVVLESVIDERYYATLLKNLKSAPLDTVLYCVKLYHAAKKKKTKTLKMRNTKEVRVHGVCDRKTKHTLAIDREHTDVPVHKRDKNKNSTQKLAVAHHLLSLHCSVSKLIVAT